MKDRLEAALPRRLTLLRASKDEHSPWPILRGSLRSRLRSERKCVRPGMTGALIYPKVISL
jgi:hypothetical protein